MSANHAAFNLIFRFVENYVSPIAGRISSQRHVMAIRDGFISAMPFMIVGSFLLVFAYPPFSPDTTWGFARAWLDMAKQFEGQILTPFDMTMGVMSLYICAAIAYNLGKHYVKTHQLDPFMCAMLSLMAFLLVAAPKTKGALPVDSLGGTGIFTAILVAIYCVEMMRFLKAHNIGIRLPDQVPPMIKNSFDLLIPVLVVVLTLYPLSLLIQSQFGMLIPQAIMSIFKPLVSAADSLPAILLAVLHRHGGLQMADQDVFVNVVGGVKVTETSADLALLLAMVSSLRDRPLPQDLVVFGEVGLAGEIRPVPSGQERISEAAKHGFRRAIVPAANVPKKIPEGMQVFGVKKLADALNVFDDL